MTAHSNTRSLRASNQQTVDQAVPLAGTEQMDVTMEDGDEKQSEEPPAVSSNTRLTRCAAHTRQLTVNPVANPVANPIATKTVNEVAPLATTGQNDIIMKDTEDDDAKQNARAPADSPKPRVTRSGARTRQSTVDLAATQNVTRAAPLASNEQMDVKMKDQEDDDGKKHESPARSPNKKAAPPIARRGRGRPRGSAANKLARIATDGANDDLPEVSPHTKAAPPTARRRGRPARKLTVDSAAANDAKATDFSTAGVPSLGARAAPPTARPRGRPRGSAANALARLATDGDRANDDSSADSSQPRAAPPTARPRGRPRGPAANTLARVANPIDPDETEDDPEYDDEQSDATPVPTASPTPRATPAIGPSMVQAHAGRHRPKRTAAELAASRSNAAAVGAKNRAMRVRTVNKHIRTLEEQAGFTYRRAFKWILGWDVLGFLDEARVLAVQEGEDDDRDGEWSE